MYNTFFKIKDKKGPLETPLEENHDPIKSHVSFVFKLNHLYDINCVTHVHIPLSIHHQTHVSCS